MNPLVPHPPCPHFPDLAPGKHLLFDNHAVADTHRLRRRIHPPVRDPVEPVLRVEKPWEGATVTPLHIVHDPAKSLWRMWYQAHDPILEEERRKLGKSKYGNVGEPQPIYCCYSESSDGIHWNRPPLGIYPDDRGPTNICFKGHSYAAGNTIVHRPDAPADERWLMVNCDWQSEMMGGIYIARSTDGLHWKYMNPDPLVFGESDTWNCLVWNPDRKVFMLYMRGWHCAAVNWPAVGKGNPRRRVSYSESRDLKTWTEPQVICTPDELDTNDFYGFQVFRYGDMFLAWLWIYDDDVMETIEIELAWSRDGIHWSRLPDRPKFLARGHPGEPGDYMLIPAQEPVVVDENLYVYWTGHPVPHGVSKHGSSGYRGRLRLDGFLSLEAGLPHGALITRPFVLQNDHITINARTDHGGIVAELSEPYYHEPEGKPVEGFTAKECDTFTGDGTAHKLSWRGSGDLRALKGKRLMLRMQLQRAQIYSFTL